MFSISYFQVIATAALTGLASYGLHSLDVDRLDKARTVAVQSQLDSDTKQCNADKAITQGVNHDLQSNLDAVRAELDRLNGLPEPKCIAVAGPTKQTPVAAVHGQHAKPNGPGNNGLSRDWLNGYAAQCESIRQTLLSCTGFVDKVWAEHAQ